MKTDLNKHLIGIFKTLKIRLDYINNSIGHSLTKGEENETEIRKLLIDFLPANYGIGSGIIVDTEGNESKQVDIIIFDKTIPNYTLSYDSKIFLLDQVLATIEIKTTFTSGSKSALEQALENVASIKKLIPSQLTWQESDLTIEADSQHKWSVNQHKPSPPICAVFFYSAAERKKAIDLDSFFSSLETELKKYENILQPDLLFSLEHSAFFKHEDLAKTGAGKFHVCLLNIVDKPSNQVVLPGITKDYKAIINFGDFSFTNNKEINAKYIVNTDESLKVIALEGDNLVLDPLVYKAGSIKNQIYYIDSYRGFMNFISTFEFALRIKKTNKNGFIKDYFPDSFFMLTDYEDGLKYI